MSKEFIQTLEDDFRDELIRLHKETCKTLYYPHTFWTALGQENWLSHIKKFINTPDSSGIMILKEKHLPELSIEYVIVNNEKYHELFTADEIKRCRETLAFISEP